jgi:hypothetical protein
MSDVDQILAIASDWRQRLLSETEAPAAIGELIASVQLTDKGIRIALKVPIPSSSEEQASIPDKTGLTYPPCFAFLRFIAHNLLYARLSRLSGEGAGRANSRLSLVCSCFL